MMLAMTGDLYLAFVERLLRDLTRKVGTAHRRAPATMDLGGYRVSSPQSR